MIRRRRRVTVKDGWRVWVAVSGDTVREQSKNKMNDVFAEPLSGTFIRESTTQSTIRRLYVLPDVLQGTSCFRSQEIVGGAGRFLTPRSPLASFSRYNSYVIDIETRYSRRTHV